MVREAAADCVDLAEQAPRWVESARDDQIRQTAGDIGLKLRRAAFYEPPLSPADLTRLESAARELHLMDEAERTLDGGATMRWIVERVHAHAAFLQRLVSQRP